MAHEKIIELVNKTMTLANEGKIKPDQAYGIKVYAEIYMQSQPEIQKFIVESIEHTLEVA